VVSHFAFGRFHGENMVVVHGKMISVVVFGNSRFNIVGGVNVEPSVKQMNGRICRKQMGDKISWVFHDKSFSYFSSMILATTGLGLF